VIDKLDFRVGAEVAFTCKFETLYRRIRSRAKATDYYQEVLNLQQYGIPAMVHLHCRYTASHKVELLGTAQMKLGEMARVVEEIFECGAADHNLARVDFAVDVPRIPVEWFWRHMRVQYKRTLRDIGLTMNKSLANGGATLYFGAGQDKFRVYDKVAQLQHKFGRTSRSLQSNQFAFYHSGELSRKDPILTRVERQVRRIPKEIATFRDLQHNATSFNPFKSVLLFPGGSLEPNIDRYSLSCYLQGNGIRSIILEIGMARTYEMLNAHSGGNANRIIRRLVDFLPPDTADFQIPNLFAMYQKSLSRQL